MKLSNSRLNDIYDRTSGYCHICGKKLAFSNYGCGGARGSWEIEHSVPRARGGTDRLTNLYAACIRCNRQKQAISSRTARLWNGRSRAPLSATKRKKAKTVNSVLGAVAGLALGGIFGPAGRFISAAVGAYLGQKHNPDKHL